MTTRKLLNFVADERRAVEASLKLNGGLRATHWLAAVKGAKFWHEGIDGVAETLTREEFEARYPESLGSIWTVDFVSGNGW